MKIPFILLLLLFLTSCQAAPQSPVVSQPATSLPSPPTQPASISQPTATLPSLPTQPPSPSPAQLTDTAIPYMTPFGGLSPTLSATSTPQGISQEMDALIPPIPPAQLTASRQQDAILLSWMGTGLDIDTHYVVYRRTSSSETREILGYVAVQGDNRGAYSYLDNPPDAGQAYSYAVTTVNRYGKESDPATVELEYTP